VLILSSMKDILKIDFSDAAKPEELNALSKNVNIGLFIGKNN